jgi:hypothetical protein
VGKRPTLVFQQQAMQLAGSGSDALCNTAEECDPANDPIRYGHHDHRGNVAEASGRGVHHHGYDQGEHTPESEPGRRNVVRTLGRHIS